MMAHPNTLHDLRSWRANISAAPTVSHLIILLLALLGTEIALSLVHIVYLQVITFHALPHLDEWRTMILFSKLEQGSSAWSLLLASHAEHRPFLPRLIFLADTRMAYGTGALSLAAIDCLLLGLVAVWTFLITRAANRSARLRLVAHSVLVLCIASLLVSGHQTSNFVRGFQVTVFVGYFFAMLTFASFASTFQPPQSGRAKQSYLPTLFSCLFGVCAAFSMGNGLIVLPILSIMACARRRNLPARTLSILAIATGVTIAAYLAAPGNLFGVLARTDYKLTLDSPFEWVVFFLKMLGGPWATILPGSVTVIGLLALLLSIYAMIKYWRRDKPWPYEVVSIGLIALTLASAAAATLARLRFGMNAATESRYSTTILALYAALLVSFWPRAHADAKPIEPSGLNIAHTAVIALFAALTLAYGIASHWKLPYDYTNWADEKADAEVAYLANVQDPLPFEHIVPQPQLELAWQARGYLRRHDLSVFSTAAARSIGRPLTDFLAAANGQCIGHFDATERIVPGANGGFRVSGWAWNTNDGSVPRTALLVADGIVKGIGRFILVRPDVVAAMPDVTLKSGFVGYVPRGVTKVTAYVLNREQTSACRIPGDLALPSG